MTDTAVSAAPRAWLFGEADFRRLWLVGVVVFAVRWLEMLAVAVFAYQRTGSPLIVALLTMLRMLPMALFGAIVGAMAALIVLALFRYVEARLPSEFYAHHMLRFQRDHVMGQEEVHKLIHDHGFTVANLSSRLSESGQQFEYRMTIKSRNRKNAEALSNYLRGRPEVIEFRITPTGD